MKSEENLSGIGGIARGQHRLAGVGGEARLTAAQTKKAAPEGAAFHQMRAKLNPDGL
ncbi:hypothetical protein NAS141_10536 [Sulfitobacter sp. NAS-14.1]|nr:hypothetical protein NAS141_10536 [Sulfitobacter sp. NAS-14.1]